MAPDFTHGLTAQPYRVSDASPRGLSRLSSLAQAQHNAPPPTRAGAPSWVRLRAANAASSGIADLSTPRLSKAATPGALALAIGLDCLVHPGCFHASGTAGSCDPTPWKYRLHGTSSKLSKKFLTKQIFKNTPLISRENN
jgi:hypothetical protein